PGPNPRGCRTGGRAPPPRRRRRWCGQRRPADGEAPPPPSTAPSPTAPRTPNATPTGRPTGPSTPCGADRPAPPTPRRPRRCRPATRRRPATTRARTARSCRPLFHGSGDRVDDPAGDDHEAADRLEDRPRRQLTARSAGVEGGAAVLADPPAPAGPASVPHPPPRRQRPRLEPLVERLAAGRVGALVLPAREHLSVSADLVRPDAGHRPPPAAMRAARVRSDMETSSPCPGPGALRRRRGHLRFAAPPYPPEA